MNRQEKQDLIQSLKKNFESSQASFVINVKGLTVEEVQSLRKSLRQEKSVLKIAKNTLLKRATSSEVGLDVLHPYFKEQVGVVFAKQDSPAVAKILFQGAQEIDRLALVGGILDQKLISKEQIQFLATLPAREVMLAQVAGTLKMPVTGLAMVLQQLIQRLLWVLKKIEEKK